MQNVQGKFGLDKVKTLPKTFVINQKGGMGDQEFDKHFITTIFNIHLYAYGVKGNYVMMKIEIGRNRMNIGLQSRL